MKNHPPSKIALVDPDDGLKPMLKAFAKYPSVTVGKMFGSVGLKTAGKVFAMVVKGRLVVKLPAARVTELISSGRGEYFDPGHGRLMKQWVALSDYKILWAELAKEAHQCVKEGKA